MKNKIYNFINRYKQFFIIDVITLILTLLLLVTINELMYFSKIAIYHIRFCSSCSSILPIRLGHPIKESFMLSLYFLAPQAITFFTRSNILSSLNRLTWIKMFAVTLIFGVIVTFIKNYLFSFNIWNISGHTDYRTYSAIIIADGLTSSLYLEYAILFYLPACILTMKLYNHFRN